MAEKIVCVTGPTACGKTKLAVLLAKRFGGEVVSADSMQIYRGMAVGTAAPTEEEMDGVPHHMIAVADPSESWSVARYLSQALPIVDDVLSRGKSPSSRAARGCGWTRSCADTALPRATRAARCGKN